MRSMMSRSIENYVYQKKQKKKINFSLIKNVPEIDKLSMFRKALIMSLIQSNYDRKNN